MILYLIIAAILAVGFGLGYAFAKKDKADF